MKRLLLLLPLLFFIVFPNAVALADDSSMSATVSPTVAMTTTNYTLPYPGILPDNPLYFFKVVRDNIVIFFISDPLKKSAFFLLQSDKRVAASWYLLKEGNAKDELALTTLAKSTNYLSQAVGQLPNASQSGENVNAQKDSIRNAITEHITTVNAILDIKSLTNKSNFAHELKRLQDLNKVVLKLSSQ